MHARSRTVLATLLTGLALLLLPAASRADTGPVDAGGADVQTAIRIAEAHWGTVPCGGAFAVSWQAGVAPQLNAVATWTNPGDLYAQPAADGDCAVALNPSAAWDWPKLCTVVTHELGHLLGHAHSPDPSDVMAATYSVPLAACAATPEPEGTLTAATAPHAQVVPTRTPASAVEALALAAARATPRRRPAARRCARTARGRACTRRVA